MLVLAGPMGPLDMEFQTAGGPLRVRADQYVWDVPGDQLVVRGLVVTDPLGLRVVSADRLVVQRVRALAGDGRAAVVTGQGVHARIELGSSGRPKFLDLLPETDDEPSDFPFSVDLKDVEIEFVGSGTRTGWHAVAILPKLRADGVGDRWLATTSLEFGSLGDLAVSMRSDPKSGLIIDGTARSLEVAPFLAYYRDTDDGRALEGLSEVRAQSMRLDGTAHAELPAEGPFRFAGRLVANGQSVGYGDAFLTRMKFDGDLTHLGAVGHVEAQDVGVSATFDGSAQWEEAFTAAGKMTASSPSSKALPKWIRAWLPEEARFERGAFDGWVSLGPDGPRATGLASATIAQWEGETLEGLSAELDATEKRVSARVRTARYMGSNLSGGIDADLVSRTLRGGGRLDRVSVERFATRFGASGWAGQMSAEAVLSGTLDNPVADLRVRGSLRRPEGNRTLDLGSLVASARFEDQALTVRRASLSGPAGSITADGEWSLRDDRLRFEVFAGGMALEAFLPELRGTGAVSATVAGSSQSLRASGRAELYGASFGGQMIPLITGDFTADRDSVLVSKFDAAKGAALAHGSLGYRFGDQGVFGQLTATRLPIAEWFGEEVTGLVDVERATLRGTLSNPKVEATLAVRDLLVYGVRAESGTVQATADAESADFTASLQAGTGKVHASGTFDVASSEVAFLGSFSNVGLPSLLATHFNALDTDGVVDGAFEGHAGPGGLADFEMSGTLQDVAVNDVPFGSGSWAVRAEEGVWSGNAMVGSLERFFEIPSFVLSQPDRALNMELVAYQLQIENLVDVVARYVPGLDPQLRERLETVRGQLDAYVVGHGRLDDPTIDVQGLQATSLELGGTPMGRLDIAARRAEGVWNVDALDWTEGPGRFTMKGSYIEGGDVSVDGELSNLDLNVLTLWRPSLAGLEGTLQALSFLVEGPAESPRVRASLSGFVGAPHDPKSDGADALRFELSALELANNEITAGGVLHYGGLEPRLSARIPFDYPFSFPEDRPLSVSLELPEREMTRGELAEVPLPLDLERSSARVAGNLILEGTPSNLLIHGGATVLAPELALQGKATTLRNVFAEIGLDDRTLGLRRLSVEGSDGGTLTAHVETATTSIQQTLRALYETYGSDPQGTVQRAWATPIKGEVVVDSARARYSGGVKGSGDLLASGNLAIAGTVKEPDIRGLLEVSQATIELPSEPLESGSGDPPFIDPRFQIEVRLVDAAHLRAGTSTMDIEGAGLLAGSLGAPDLGANLTVLRGIVRLPTSRVALEPGGTMRLRYAGSPGVEAIARLDIDLEGRTNVTALRFGDQVERYIVTLNMRGDLLEDGGVRMTATSDPPDLGSDRILRLLGQAELFEGLASVLKPGSGTSQFQGAVASVAIPVVFDPITERLAVQLGLDYLTIEYNRLDQTTISAAKSLGHGLILQARRQVGDPAPGFPVRYDLRLAYRIPTRDRYLGRTTFSIGRDQDRPWKISIEYGSRF